MLYLGRASFLLLLGATWPLSLGCADKEGADKDDGSERDDGGGARDGGAPSGPSEGDLGQPSEGDSGRPGEGATAEEDASADSPFPLGALADLPDDGVELDCGGRDIEGARVVSGRIEENERWDGLIYLSEDVRVATGAHLEIAPGTKVIVAAEQHLTVDDFSTLSALGTKRAPILFCGEVEEENSWEGIRVLGDPSAYEYDDEFDIDPLKDLGVALQYVLIENAGGGRFAPFESERLALLRGVQIGPTRANAMSILSFARGSEGLVLGETGRAALVLDHVAALEELPFDIDFRGGEYGYVMVSAMTDSGGSVRLEKRDYEYFFEDDSSFQKLTIEAGVRLVSAHLYLELEVNELQALGTEEEPVVMHGGLTGGEFFVHAGAGSTLRHVEIDGKLYVQAGGSSLDHVSAWALHLERDAAQNEEQSGLSSDSRGIVAKHIYVASSSILFSLPRDTQTEGDGPVNLTFDTVEQSGTIPALAAPYDTGGHLLVRDGAHLTLEPGVELRFSRGDKFEVANGARLTARGTEDAPIVLTEQSPGAPCSEHWDGLIVRDTAGEVELSHIEVRLATPSLALYRPIQLSDSLLYGSCGDGIVHAADDDTDYAQSNRFEGVLAEAIVSR